MPIYLDAGAHVAPLYGSVRSIILVIAAALPMPALAGSNSLTAGQELQVLSSVELDQFEYVRTSNDEWLAYDGEASLTYGDHRVVLKAEGEVANGRLQDSETELVWSRPISGTWDIELGLRLDRGYGLPDRNWFAFGVQSSFAQGLDIEVTAYVGRHGRTAFALTVEHDLALTERLHLQPRIDIDAYGKSDEARDLGHGLTEGTAALRLRYALTPDVEPYIGVQWSTKFGKTADLAAAAGDRRHELRWLAGLGLRF